MEWAEWLAQVNKHIERPSELLTRLDTRPSPVADGWAGADIRFSHFPTWLSWTDILTDGWMDGRTHKASYRVASPLKRSTLSKQTEWASKWPIKYLVIFDYKRDQVLIYISIHPFKESSENDRQTLRHRAIKILYLSFLSSRLKFSCFCVRQHFTPWHIAVTATKHWRFPRFLASSEKNVC